MIGGIRIGRVLGIELRADWSWVLIFLLMTWSLASTFAGWHPEWTPAEDFLVAVAGALAFSASVLLHELAHAAVAEVQGLKVRSITLFLFGGVSNIEREPTSPRVELITAIAGPALSLVLGALLLTGVAVLRGLPADPASAPVHIASLGPVGSLSLWLGAINVVIGLFNLIPAFPLDGGRLLRAAVWGATRDVHAATHAASVIGQMFGWIFVVLGIAMSFGARVPVFGTGLASGMWLAFIGWFVASAAAQSFRRALVDEAIAGLSVSSLMRRRVPMVAASTSVDALVREGFMRTSDRSFPVREGTVFVGLACIDDVRRVPQEAWSTTPVRAIMTPRDALTVARPDELLIEAMTKLTRLDVEQLPVIEDGELIGMLRRRDIGRWVEVQSGHTRLHRTSPSGRALAH